MKIGELAKACGVSKDTIRYYVEKGLLIPFKKGLRWISRIVNTKICSLYRK